MQKKNQQFFQQVRHLLQASPRQALNSTHHEIIQELSPFAKRFIQSQRTLRSLELHGPALAMVLGDKKSVSFEEKASLSASGNFFFIPQHLGIDVIPLSLSTSLHEVLILEFPATVLERFRQAYPEQVRDKTPPPPAQTGSDIELEVLLFPDLAESVIHLIRSLTNENKTPASQSQHCSLHQHHLMEVLLLLLQSNVRSRVRQTIYPDFATQIRYLIRTNLASEWSLERLAQAMDISVSTLKRRLRSANVGYRQLLDEESMGRAKELLQQGNQNIAHIALACGYKSQSRFAARFRKYYGLSPSQVRTQDSQV